MKYMCCLDLLFCCTMLQSLGGGGGGGFFFWGGGGWGGGVVGVGRTDIGALVLCALRQNLFLNIHRSRDRNTETHNIPTKSFD